MDDILVFRTIKGRIKKSEDTKLYNIVTETGIKLIKNDLPLEDVKNKFETLKRKAELIEKEGFKLRPHIGLMNGFERYEDLLYKKICGVDIYILRRKKDEWGIVGACRSFGQDFVCDVYTKEIKEITEEIINNVVRSVQDKVAKWKRDN